MSILKKISTSQLEDVLQFADYDCVQHVDENGKNAYVM